MINIICGTVTKRKKFYFYFDVDKKILTIQPKKMNKNVSFLPEFDFEEYPYFKNSIDLEGETNKNAYIRFINVKFISIGRGCFQAWVPAYILGTANAISPIVKPNKINKITFKGECIDRFMTSKSTASNVWDSDKSKLQVNIDYNKSKIKNFLYENLEIKLVPGWKLITGDKDVNTLLTMITSLVIKSEKSLSINKIIEIYQKMEKLFSFICHRHHVEFSSIILNQVEPIAFINELRDTSIDFELHVSSHSDDYDLPKIGRTMILNDYIEKMPMLIKCICENDFMLLSFPTKSLSESVIDNDKYLNVSSAFESEFDLMYPKFKSSRNKNYNEAKTATLEYLKQQSLNKEYNYKKREYFDSLYDFIDKVEGRLSEQIRYVFQSYSYIVEAEQKYFSDKYPSINYDINSLSTAFSNKRDKLTHGSELEKFNKVEIAAYSIIRKVNYAMILERAGFEKNQIKEIVYQVL